MPEYFVLSFILRKTPLAKEKIRECLAQKFGLLTGEHESKFWENRTVLIYFFDDEGTERDFEELCICLPNQVFHKNIYVEELAIFTMFVNTCFEHCDDLQFVACGYELCIEAKKLEFFNDELLSIFPIIYRRIPDQQHPLMMINLEAQDILE